MENNIKLFKFFRPRDISLNIAVSSKKGFVDSYIFDSGSGLNTVEKNGQRNGKLLLKKTTLLLKSKKIN